MTTEPTIIDVTAENLSDYPQVVCFINQKHPTHHLKVDWLTEQFKNGLKIKLLYIQEQKRPFGFVEYTPGEHCWRAISAEGYMFIHCLWTNGKKFQHQGLGSLLLEAAERDSTDKLGMVAVTSDQSFMANRDIFLKNGYDVITESGKNQLLVKPFKDGPLPSINDWESELARYRGLTIVYSRQCPWVARFIEEVQPVLQQEGLTPEIIELTSAEAAQKAPSLYSVFNLIYDGRLLADRYISVTRFKNIIKKEISVNDKRINGHLLA